MSTRSIEQDIARQMRAAERERRRMTIAAVAIGGSLVLGGGLLTLGWLAGSSGPEEEPAFPKRIDSAIATSAPEAETEAEDSTTPPKASPATVTESPVAAAPSSPTKKPSVQRFSIGIGDYGYEPTVIRAAAGAPVVLTIAQGEGCAAGFLIPELGVSADNTVSDARVELPALSAGIYRFTCGMEMVEGRLVIE